MNFKALLILLILSFSSPSWAEVDSINLSSQEIVVPSELTPTTDKQWANKIPLIIDKAYELTGVKYKLGGSKPETGFDCSQFVKYVFEQALNLSLPPSARSLSKMGETIKFENLQPGDLVFFNTRKSKFSHVGIYVGNNEFIHAPRTGKTIRVENLTKNYWLKRFSGATRVDPAETL
ncbi:C40 family peptidase [Candidatus Methylopumilus planktonicus]|uniref:C40 family peptidase n=1 Tax=Candidatus Methylopumilus planktonicus TaxID=1581557 RepID=UPI0011222B76|nr:C40 family peptidase [Candidatus Methylopumilus planktonicus]QDC99918.1 NlpC/P60 family protein [Candidatus Methylopumilus planktonicus]